MKFYETNFEEYLEATKKYDLHPELAPFIENLPPKVQDMGNLIVYGPPGVGKYSQVLKILQKYSGTHLKYDKKIQFQNEKQDYKYHISDIHYEIDMSMLGCNSKILWNDIFLQIIDIVSVKSEKIGFIVCKNFHTIHSELLEIFYSYIQQYSKSHYKNSIFNYNIVLHFILITENLSFLPNNILNSCHVLNVKRPAKEQYQTMITRNLVHKPKNVEKICEILETMDCSGIQNIKEVYSFAHIKGQEFPKDLFNVICDNIIREIKNPKKLSFMNFRDIIYDILTYNLDAVECIWYILYYFINSSRGGQPWLSTKEISDILEKSHWFLKYYNNNYRPIYHLESMLFYIINKVHGFENGV